MLTMYPAYIYTEKDGGYSAVFPDLNHLSTCGQTLEELFAMAQDCLAGHICFCNEQGYEIPKASTIAQLNNPDSESDDYLEVFTNMIIVNVEEYAEIHFDQEVEKTLTIPSWLNDEALKYDINFSKVLKDGLIKELQLNLS